MKYLLILPFVGLLWLPFYNDTMPAILGFPFFYWYQLALGAHDRVHHLPRLAQHAAG